MSEFLDSVFSTYGCQVDGSTGFNPVNQLVDNFMESMGTLTLGGSSADIFDTNNFMASHEQFYGDNLIENSGYCDDVLSAQANYTDQAISVQYVSLISIYHHVSNSTLIENNNYFLKKSLPV